MKISHLLQYRAQSEQTIQKPHRIASDSAKFLSRKKEEKKTQNTLTNIDFSLLKPKTH